MKRIRIILSVMCGILSAVLCVNVSAANIGVCTHMSQPHNGHTISGITDAAAELHADMIRDELRWGWGMQTTPGGTFKMPTADWTGAAEQSGLKALVILGLGNEAYEGGGGLPVSSDTDYWNGWLGYVRYVVGTLKTRQPDTPHTYEVWNEPNHNVFNPDVESDAAESARNYAELLRATYEAVKNEDPNAKVLGAAHLIGGTSDTGWLNSLLNWKSSEGKGVIDYMDGFSFHYYNYKSNNPESDLGNSENRSLKMIVNYLNQSDPQKTKELWLTETGWFTTGGSNGVTEEEQAAFALRVKLAWDKLLKNIGRKGELFWYDLRNDGTDPAYAGHNFGLIDYNYRPKPAFYAVKTYNKLLRGREFVGMSDKPYLARYTDTETGDSTYIAYTSGGSGSVTVPQSGSAVHIYDYLGRLTETVSEPSGDITVEVGEEPTFIHCKTYRTEITDMKYDKNKNICTVSGRAEDFETAEITLWDESGNCVQTESAKVGSDGEFHKMFSVSKPGRYTVKICKSEMEAAGSSLIGTAELDASRPQFSGDTVLRGIVTEFDALSGMTVVTGSLTDRVSGEPSDGLVNVLVLPEGADTDNVNLSNAVWIGDAEVKNGVFTCEFKVRAGGDYSLHLRSAASDREDSIFGSDGTVTYTFGLSGTASEITAETSIDGGGAPDSARLIIAQYKDGSLIDVRSKEIRPSDAADASLTVKRVEGVDMFKAYVWDGSELRPIIPSVSKKQR